MKGRARGLAPVRGLAGSDEIVPAKITPGITSGGIAGRAAN